jgi:hypothetical protein
MPDLAERQISFAHRAAPATAFLIVKLWTRRSTQCDAGVPLRAEGAHGAFSLE